MDKSWLNEKHLNQWGLLQKSFASAMPFPHLEIRDFLETTNAKRLAVSVLAEKFREKDSDLFRFLQTQDLTKTDNFAIKSFHEFWQSKEFLKFIGEITQTRLKSIDMSGFIYRPGDYLLAHDDRLEGRKIAYIINLSENFEEKDGGSLDLFEVEGKHPVRVARSIMPTFNTLTIFKVLPISFHQVREITKDKKRLSVAGWFHD